MPDDMSTIEIPLVLRALARDLRGLTWEAAKRFIASKVGSAHRGERFSDDVADAVFLRLQRTTQVGTYATERELARLGRNACRLDGPSTITLYRSAPPGSGIRPGDCAAGSAHEAGFYRHGGNVVQSATVPRTSVFQIDGSVGGGQEYIYLPHGYTPPTAITFYRSLKGFWDAANNRIHDDDPICGQQATDCDADGATPAFRMRR